MRNLTCIVCPIGCSLEVQEDDSSPDNLSVTGNRCARGVNYAREEIRSPKRVVTATCLIEEKFQNEHSSVRRIPVKTSSPCPKEKIPDILKDIYKIKISLPVKTGDIIIADWNGEKIDVVATRTMID
ncbi:MAG: DUF1667 domain-containing protein [Treponema sp.]|nr:DUF1667 domain-containing protein [Treponema sp.]MCL2251604.1 DUF1667 domain-containing protein [Treponema sp.]